jgi:hypothetical protein
LVEAMHDASQQCLGLLRRVQLVAVVVLQPFTTGADREEPVGAHLYVVVGGLQRLVVESVTLGLLIARCPDHRLMGILEATAAEVRHRIGLAPDDIVEDPEAEILHLSADAEDVVIGADHPDGAVRLQNAARREQPCAGEGIVSLETLELVPMVIDRVNLGLVRPMQCAFQLQIVGRIGKDHVHRFVGKGFEGGNTIALDDAVDPGKGVGRTAEFGNRKHRSHRLLTLTLTQHGTRCLWLPKLVTEG